MKSTQLNLEAIQKAIIQHNGNCDFPVTGIWMAPFEVDRLGFDNFNGIPIRADEKMETGRFRLTCERDNVEPVGRAVESVEAGENVPIKIGGCRCRCVLIPVT